MSHISKVETRLKDMQTLVRALSHLGYETEEAREGVKLTLEGWNGETLEADLVIRLEGPFSIGVNRREEGLELSADWWGVETYTDRKQDEILGEIQKQYAYETVMDKISAGGYSVVTEEQDSGENLHIVVRRWI
ncbi:MAG: DUF1257 domain-containing protein [Spirochaetales bacterium]|nr:DUF1257 domain-containing protein [Spirochaetales bacterium]